VGWTIFTAIDLYVGVVLLDLMAPSVPPERLPLLRKAKKVALILFGASLLVLAVQFARSRAWI
jgi:hypothetical protein